MKVEVFRPPLWVVVINTLNAGTSPYKLWCVDLRFGWGLNFFSTAFRGLFLGHCQQTSHSFILGLRSMLLKSVQRRVMSNP